MKLKTKLVVLVTGVVSISWSLMLTFQILQLINATELMWFLFWTNMPMVISVSLLGKLLEE